MKVRIPSPLYSYTKGRAEVEGRGSTLGEVLTQLDADYPGLRFRIVDEQDRIRTHIMIHVNAVRATSLAMPVGAADEVMIVAWLSGG